MATINNTIYPPIIPTYQKAFLKEKTSNVLFNIKFNISEYTTITDVQTVEVKVMTLEGNTSILKGDHYVLDANEVVNPLTRTGSIDIMREDTVIDTDKNVDINFGQFYVIQLRVGQSSYKDKDGNPLIINGDSENAIKTQQQYFTEDVLEKFSEWSTMSLIKCIDTPVLTMMDGSILLSRTNRVSDMSDIMGYLTWKNKDASEYLYSYRFRIYDVDDIPSKYINDYETIFKEVEPLEDTGVIRASTASPNRLHYIFRSDFIDEKRYRMFITYETDNEYSKTEYFNFYIQNFISSSNLAGARAKLTAFANNEIGGNEINLTMDDSYLSVPSKYLVFRRSTSDTDFKLWDDIHTVRLTSKNVVIDSQTGISYLNYDWIDYTAENGVFYKYCVQEVDLVDNRAEKIIATPYGRTEDYYKSLMECINPDSDKVDPENVLKDISYSFETEVDNSFWINDVTKNQLKSNDFALIEEHDYRGYISLTTNIQQKIKVKIEDVQSPGVFLKQQIFDLQEEKQELLEINFTTLVPNQRIRIIIEPLTNKTVSLVMKIDGIEIHKIRYKKVLPDKEKIDNLILDFHDSFLINENNTLKLGFDTEISSITKTRKDTITETLNSKYPFIYRSGEVEYDSYNISGTISILGDLYTTFNQRELKDSLSEIKIDYERVKLHDTDNLFANERSLLKYDDVYQIYKQYQEKYNYNIENDFNIEKMFRDKVETFLSDGSPKLFKNVGLGNRLVMLTDVSLSPKDTVGNRIYTFSATMTEIDETTVENYNNYNIINLNYWRRGLVDNNITIEDLITETENVIGQYSYIPTDIDKTNLNIFEKIKQRYETTNTNYIRTISDIYKIKIDLSELTIPLEDDVLGKVQINEKQFIISRNHPFLELDNIDIKSFMLEVNNENTGKVVIDYLTRMNVLLIYSTDGWHSFAENQLGQIYKEYNLSNPNIYEDIYFKYFYKDANNSMEKKLASVKKLLIQAYADKEHLIPYKNVIIGIQDEKNETDKDSQPYIHKTDSKGIIDLYDDKKERSIKNIIYKGIKITRAEDVNNPKDTEYLDIDERLFKSKEELFENINNLQEHIIYKVGKLSLSFYYNNERLKYDAEVSKDTLNVEIDPNAGPTRSADDVSRAIKAQLESGTADLDLLDEDVKKYIFINNQLYELNEEHYIQLPVWLKVTYLFEYLTRKKVED